MDVDTFIQWENSQADKHEYLSGEVSTMQGARRVHATVVGNCVTLLKSHLRPGPCRAYMADMKLAVRRAEAVFYPDVLVTCHPADYGRRQ